jgi:hypothetical protein
VKWFKEIHNLRLCGAFYKHRAGYSPKDHQEMIAYELVQEREEKWRRHDNRWRIVNIAVAILAAIVSVIALIACVFGVRIIIEADRTLRLNMQQDATRPAIQSMASPMIAKPASSTEQPTKPHAP